jgi:hypothetical protein
MNTSAPLKAEELRLRALIAPLGTFALEALTDYAWGDPTHASSEDIGAALEDVTELSQTLRDQLAQVLEPPLHPWWQVWRW